MSLNHIALFANPNGQNGRLLEFIETFGERDQVDVAVVSLAERLPTYANFPAHSRKLRLEEVLSNAASETARSLTLAVAARGLTCRDPEIVSGKFPDEIEKWVEAHKPDLLVKQSLPCDGEFGHVSKGDLRLSRHVSVPILLINAKFRSKGSILVGVPPIFPDQRGLARAVKLVEHGIFWARKLGAALQLVHAWELFGESFLRSRSLEGELEAELASARDRAEKEVATVIDESKIPRDVDYEVRIYKGDPTRVLMANLELLKPTMVVLGSVANEGVKRALLGNTAETLARRNLTNTLIIK